MRMVDRNDGCEGVFINVVSRANRQCDENDW